MNEKIIPFDINRMLFGDAPPEFLIEVFFRGLALYLFMLFIMRYLGKRMAGELTVTEMVLMVTLGGSVAVAIQVPEGGVLMGFVVLTCALLFERGLSWITIKSPRFENLSQGEMSVLVKDGVLQVNKMKDNRITRQQVFATLRGEKVHQLGMVERLYLEAGGTFSVYQKAGDPPPGLAVLPADDTDMIASLKKAPGVTVCSNCGYPSPEAATPCIECAETSREEAVL